MAAERAGKGWGGDQRGPDRQGCADCVRSPEPSPTSRAAEPKPGAPHTPHSLLGQRGLWPLPSQLGQHSQPRRLGNPVTTAPVASKLLRQFQGVSSWDMAWFPRQKGRDHGDEDDPGPTLPKSTREVQGEAVGRGPERTEPRGVGWQGVMSHQGSGLGSGSATEPF